MKGSRRTKIAIDTNIWISAYKKEKSRETKVCKELIEKITNFTTQQMFNIVILLPKILELELLEELIKDAKSVKYIKKYETTFDIRGIDRKEVLREIKLSKKEIEKKEKFLKGLEASGIVEIKDCKIAIKKVENLVKSGIELKDALILVQSNCLEIDYFVTRDGDILGLASKKPKWLKFKIVKPRTMIEILSKETKKITKSQP